MCHDSTTMWCYSDVYDWTVALLFVGAAFAAAFLIVYYANGGRRDSGYSGYEPCDDNRQPRFVVVVHRPPAPALPSALP
jgi:hypothetical protein